MKTKDIVVGQKYRHRAHDKAVYLGMEDAHGRKSLVIIENSFCRSDVGHTVISQALSRKKFGFCGDFWEGFSPIFS
jgi:hypothetical protein